ATASVPNSLLCRVLTQPAPSQEWLALVPPSRCASHHGVIFGTVTVRVGQSVLFGLGAPVVDSGREAQDTRSPEPAPRGTNQQLCAQPAPLKRPSERPQVSRSVRCTRAPPKCPAGSDPQQP